VLGKCESKLSRLPALLVHRTPFGGSYTLFSISFNLRTKALTLKLAGDEGFDLPLAGPKLRDCQTSWHRKVSLQTADWQSSPRSFSGVKPISQQVFSKTQMGYKKYWLGLVDEFQEDFRQVTEVVRQITGSIYA